MIRAAAFACLAMPALALAQDHALRKSAESVASPYAGMERRAIKSLSKDDIAELRRGGGWGLALLAELNGVPGPAHALALRDELALTKDQAIAVEAVFAAMQADAKAVGERFIAAEAALETAFRAGGLTSGQLCDLLAASAEARAALCLAHLSRHFETLKVLSARQIARYAELRG